MIDRFKGVAISLTSERVVAWALADAHNGQTGRCDLSVASLMRLTGLSDRGVQKALRGLADSGHLTTLSRSGTSNQYSLHPRTQFTPEHSSPLPRTEFTPPPNTVHPNRNITGTEPELNPPEASGENQKRKDWRDFNQAEADQANGIPIPQHFPDEFKPGWERWKGYRTSRAVDARTRSEAIPWTAGSAEAEIRNCERFSKTHGWGVVIAQFDVAISGQWRGMNLQNLQRSQPTRTVRPTDNSDVKASQMKLL